ncbi:acyltransferase family protein [Aliivibrio fischeri]|uniref:acyltransferase family protein n=1 Tax=Aliivibrio fischeri TaxID=668 RepID=UPI003736FEDF
MKDRDKSLDSIKGVMIIFVVFGHIIYKGDFRYLFQNIHDLVYIFHMPIFLMLSGYFFKCNLTVDWLKNITVKLVIPYLLSFSFYLFILYIVEFWGGIDTSNHVSGLHDAIKSILVSPFASYWYLHSLIIFSLLFYISSFLCFKLNINYFILPSTIVLYSILHFSIFQFNVKYFYWVAGYIWLGYVFHSLLQSYNNSCVNKVDFITFVIITLVVSLNLISDFDLKRTLISILVFSLLYLFFNVFKLNWLSFIGRNSLLIFLFHVYFLNLSKLMSNVFISFDGSGTVFLLFSLIFSIVGSLFLGRLIERLNMSRFILGTSNAIN